jgi:hypothetical protein
MDLYKPLYAGGFYAQDKNGSDVKPPHQFRNQDRGVYPSVSTAAISQWCYPPLGPWQFEDSIAEPLVLLWEEGFRRYQLDVSIQYEMQGTSSAIPALFTDVGDMAILDEEIDPAAVPAFERVKHYPPTGEEIMTGVWMSEIAITRKGSLFTEIIRSQSSLWHSWMPLSVRNTGAARAIFEPGANSE